MYVLALAEAATRIFLEGELLATGDIAERARRAEREGVVLELFSTEEAALLRDGLAGGGFPPFLERFRTEEAARFERKRSSDGSSSGRGALRAGDESHSHSHEQAGAAPRPRRELAEEVDPVLETDGAVLRL